MNSWTIDWRDLYLSGQGRLARTPFLIGAGILVVLMVLYEGVFTGLFRHLLTGWLVYPAAIWAGACVLSKRLHDRGKSGWWAALILVAVGVAWPHPNGFFDFLLVLVVVWAVVELAVLPGEQGANRFGPNPMKPVSAYP
ncbi:DUF805 domain-containing protein [Phenylobacterium montanum]|uniref:DUF805 domain-containing protein n=1 Tax=Phenylobacterium montanum TaxID=2823693 RepID=A0A975IVA1_9CAUL|nr:DUF805 domain-containing protein [Caulobacter sp. S6]QUD88623.1 DUF805 domain-containing protein [Caulobacter sp. S6]